jgi:hypothetical protein
LEDGDDLANQAQDQEQEGKAALGELDKKSPDDEKFEGQLTQFAQAGRAHIAFEETSVWPYLRAALSADDLGREITEGKQNVPTRPHPKTPASPAVLKAAGPAVAAADRLRDAVTGRDE